MVHASWCSTTSPSCSSGIFEQRISVTGYDEMDQQRGLLFRGFELSGDICRLLFMVQKSITSRTSNKEYGIDLRRFLRHLEFPGQSVSRCSDVQLKADTWSIFFNLQKVKTPRPWDMCVCVCVYIYIYIYIYIYCTV